MIINTANLDALRVGFQTSFEGGLGQAASMYTRIATVVPSSTRENRYGWLGQMPSVREWVGERHVHGLASHDYSIVNRSFEMTVGVPRDDIEDDIFGVYAPLFEEMGMAVGAQPDEMIFGLLKDGFTTPCYDGQYYFDTDHRVLGANGEPTTVSNTGGGSGDPWFLLCANRALKPLIFQDRRAPQFVRKDRADDDNVFDRKEFVYGVDCRRNAGFGFWQMAYGSKDTLNATNYAAARAALQGMKGDYGRPLGLVPNLLVVPPSLEGAALEILNAERDSAGATNV